MPKTDKKVDTTLALDPGLRALGYAILTGPRIMTAGVLPLRDIPPRRRLPLIREALDAWIRAYRPSSLVLEVIPNRPLDSLAGLPALGRLIRHFARRRRLRLATYSAKTVRRTVVGDGWAGKHETARAVVHRFPELRVCLTQDRKWKEAYWQNMFDAVALGLHAQEQRHPPSRSRASG